MKTRTTNIRRVIKNTSASVVLALLMIAASGTTAQAQDKLPASIEVKYLGSVNYQPVLLVEFANAEEEELYVTLKDDDGQVLYSERFKDKKFSRKFQFDRGALENITVTISSSKGKGVQVFHVNKSIRTVEDIIITKVR